MQLLGLYGPEEQRAGALNLGGVAGERRLGIPHGRRVDPRRGPFGRPCRGGNPLGLLTAGHVEPAAAGELLRVVGLVEAGDLDHIAGVWGVDELVPSKRDSDVVDITARVAEEDQVAWDQVAAVHRVAVRGEYLLLRGARDLDADLRVGPLHEARAVEAGLGGGAAPSVRRPQLAPRGSHGRDRSPSRQRAAPAGHRVDLL